MNIRNSLALLCVSALSLHGMAQDSIAFRNTIAVPPGLDSVDIIRRAVHVVPTPNQLAAMKDEFIAFVHFGPNTFTRREWGNGMESPEVFDLKSLDTDQWCRAMQAAGMKKVIITAKHHDGFVLWQSRYTRHGIMSTNFRGGQGDVLKDLAASCRKYGLKLGIYLSPADLFQIESPTGLYGNLSKYTLRTIPREVPGRPFANKAKFRFLVDDYNEYFLNQLFELLTEYGPISEVWFDGAHPKRKGGQQYNYQAWKELIHRLAPEAVIFGREDVRWCGNESGATRTTEWNVVPYQVDPDTAAHFADMTDPDLGSRSRLLHARYLHYQPAETNTSIREGWFYRDDTDQRVRSADDVFDIYERAVGGNSIFLLNIPPNREGRFSPADVSVLEDVGSRIRATYSDNLLSTSSADKALLDGDVATAVQLPADTGQIVLSLPRAVTANRIVLQEAVAQSGERIERHAVDAWVDGQWKEIARATNIGYKRILRFPDVTASQFRLRVLQSRAVPSVATFAAYHYASRPPQLAAWRSDDGLVTIAPKAAHFAWKAHGQDIAGNLNQGFKIFYTTDGSQPTASSAEYVAPFPLANEELRAVAIVGGHSGTALRERFGLLKGGWKVTERTAGHLTIDLGAESRLEGFAFTPKKQGGPATVAGSILVSTDGEHWQQACTFNLGNLVNDPSKRSERFPKKVKARYVKIDCAAIAATGDAVAISSVDLY